MSDHEWQSPGQSPRADNGQAQPAAAPIAPAGGYYQPGGSATPPGWTPPPKPGLIPLRPLDLGAILGGSFSVLRRNPKPTFGVALLIQGVVSIVAVGVIALVSYFSLGRVSTSTEQDASAIMAGSYGAIGLAAIVPVLLSLAASALLQGIIVVEVSRGSVGEKLGLRQIWRRARGRVWALIGWTALVTAVVLVSIAILVGLILIFSLFLGVAGTVAAVVLGIFGGLGALVIGVWFATKLSLVPSAIMIERLSVRQAIARSWLLTNGYFWRTFGIQLLINVILNAASGVISIPLSVVAPLLVTLIDPNGQQGPTTVIVVWAVSALSLIITVVFAAITSVVQTAATALIYLDLRMRKEGLDLELARYVEAQSAGDLTVPDPYLRQPTPWTSSTPSSDPEATAATGLPSA